MKNFKLYFAFLLGILPFFAFGGNVIEVNQLSGTGGDDGTYIPGSITIQINLNNPSGNYEAETLTFPAIAEPLFLVVRNDSYEIMVEAVELNDITYIRTQDEDKKCFVYRKELALTDRDVFRTDCEFGSVFISEKLTFSIAEFIDGSFVEPQSYLNKMLIGTAPSFGKCLTYIATKTFIEIACVSDEQIGLNDPESERSENTERLNYDSSAFSYERTNKTLKSILPNPFSDELVVEIIGMDVDGEMKVFSVNGKLIYEQNLNRLNKIPINTSTWKKGIYLVQIIINDNLEAKKIIKF